jgi:cytochrome c peroxidase
MSASSERAFMKHVLWVCASLLLAACGGGRSLPTSPTNGAPPTPSAPGTPASVTAALTIDFLAIASYAGFLPAYYDGTVTRLDNSPDGPAIDNRVATLGRVLFYDRRLSSTDTISCASCHQQALGFSDARRFSVGVGGLTTAHSPRLGNVRYYAPGSMFWDRRAPSLEAQASQPIVNPVEMGFSSGIGTLIAKMNDIAYYPDLFTFAFGSREITETRIQQALAQFERAMISTSSRWDSAYAQVFTPGGDRGLDVDLPGFSAQENRGRALFIRGTAPGVTCATCHVPPTFALAADAGGIGLDAGETRVFKAPSLKHAGTGPYMHDGRFSTLEEVLQHYDGRIQPGPALDARLRNRNGFNLSNADRAALAAFLRTLDDPVLSTDPRFSNPFRQP